MYLSATTLSIGGCVIRPKKNISFATGRLHAIATRKNGFLHRPNWGRPVFKLLIKALFRDDSLRILAMLHAL